MAPERIQLSDDQIIMGFAASCVEWAAEVLDCDYQEIFNRMDKVGLIENYIIANYGVLHMESRQNVTNDIIETLELWESNERNN